MELLNYMKIVLRPECRLFRFVIYTIMESQRAERASARRILTKLLKPAQTPA
jgi:hypothetical protein